MGPLALIGIGGLVLAAAWAAYKHYMRMHKHMPSCPPESEILAAVMAIQENRMSDAAAEALREKWTGCAAAQAAIVIAIKTRTETAKATAAASAASSPAPEPVIGESRASGFPDLGTPRPSARDFVARRRVRG